VRRSGRLLVVAAAVAALTVLAGAAAWGGRADGPAVEPLLVAAASDLRPALEELADRHRARTGAPVTLSFGSSGQLARQIVHGAPFDLFASADVAYVDEVVAAGRGTPGTRAEYAVGRLAVWAPAGGAVRAVAIEELDDPAFARIAIANPAHAPYGRAALQALEAAGVQVADRLVFGESVSDAQRLVRSGNVEVGVIALSLARASPEGSMVEVPHDLHEPLRQGLVVTAPPGRREAARGFAALVVSEEVRAVLRRHGFRLPAGGAPGGG
jgi:molybdate transport system substrate-binding protein